MKCGVENVKCGLWSVKCGVESGECRLWSVESEVYKVWSVTKCHARHAKRHDHIF